MTILIVYWTLKGLVVSSFAFIYWVYFTFFFDYYIEKKCFYSFRSSHYFYKIAALNQCQTMISTKPITICLCKCSILIKVAGYKKKCFYPFRSSHYFYKIAALNQCQTMISTKPITICLCKCSILIKVACYRPLNEIPSLVKDFDHAISLMLCGTAILKNIYFSRISSSMAASVH